jgi:hypothetical protein
MLPRESKLPKLRSVVIPRNYYKERGLADDNPCAIITREALKAEETGPETSLKEPWSSPASGVRHSTQLPVSFFLASWNMQFAYSIRKNCLLET